MNRSTVTVLVHIQRAHGLPAADLGGTSDPYCCLTLEHDPPLRKPHSRDFHKKTHVVKKTLDPVWGEILELHSENAAREFVRFYIFDHDNVGSDDFLCWGEVVLAEVKAAGGHVEKVVSLHHAKKSSTAGELNVAITYGTPQQAPPPPPPSQVYWEPQPVAYGPPPTNQPPPSQPVPVVAAPTVQLDARTLKRAASLGLHGPEVDDAYRSFQAADLDKSGNVSFDELKKVLKATVAKTQKDDVLDRYARYEFQSVDLNHNNNVDFYEFLQVYAAVKGKLKGI